VSAVSAPDFVMRRRSRGFSRRGAIYTECESLWAQRYISAPR